MGSCPLSTVPGHQAIPGTRTPPSKVSPFSPRSREYPPCGCIAYIGPLSLIQTTNVFRNTQFLDLLKDTADIVVVFGHLRTGVGAGGLVHKIWMCSIKVISFARVIGEEGLLAFGVSLDEIDDAIGYVSIHGVVEFQGEGRNHLRLFWPFFPLMMPPVS